MLKQVAGSDYSEGYHRDKLKIAQSFFVANNLDYQEEGLNPYGD